MKPKLKNLDYWVTATVDPSKAYDNWYKEEEKYLINNIKKNSFVLDVACGNGRNLKQIEKLTNNLFGLDHDPIAEKSFYKLFPNKNAKFVLGKAEDMPVEDNYFDVVMCIGSFANFGDLKYKILEEMKRVIKKNGIIILSLYSENAFEERMNLYKKFNCPIIKVEGKTVYFDESLGDTISEQFSKKQLEEIFDKVNLRIENIKELEIAYLIKLHK